LSFGGCGYPRILLSSFDDDHAADKGNEQCSGDEPGTHRMLNNPAPQWIHAREAFGLESFRLIRLSHSARPVGFRLRLFRRELRSRTARFVFGRLDPLEVRFEA
jgi:hypothetical protein